MCQFDDNQGMQDSRSVLSHPSQHPFQALTPDVVLDALAAVGLYGDGRLTALSSYENRVYLVHLEQGLDRDAAAPASVVVKFYRPQRWTDAQINEEHDFSVELMQAEIPVVGPLMLKTVNESAVQFPDEPPLGKLASLGGSPAREAASVGAKYLHQHAGFSFSVSPQRGGRTPELDDFEVLEWIGRFLARIHTVGAAKPFVHRPALDVQSFGIESMDWLLSHDMVPLDVQAAWQKKCIHAIDIRAKYPYFAQVTGKNILQSSAKNDNQAAVDAGIASIRLHGDCHPGNILWTPTDVPNGGPHFVDLDDARSGPAVQDLWMLLSGDRRQRTTQLSALIDGYEQFRPFDRRELELIEPLRTLRLIHYSAWLARRWQDPIFPINFPWFGSSDYWTSQVHMLKEQIEAMQEEPLMV